MMEYFIQVGSEPQNYMIGKQDRWLAGWLTGWLVDWASFDSKFSLSWGNIEGRRTVTN